MSHYRVYPIQPDGHRGPHYSGPARVIDCSNDEEAIRKAKPSVAGSDVEVWEGARFIKLVQRKSWGA
jgi:hypothetical protein